MRETKIYCDRCSKEIKLQTGSEIQFSGWLINLTREQLGSFIQPKQYEVCFECIEKVKDFITGKIYLDMVYKGEHNE